MERKIELKLKEFNVKQASNVTFAESDSNVKMLRLDIDNISIALDFCVCQQLDKMFSDIWITNCPLYPNSSSFAWSAYCSQLDRVVAITMTVSTYYSSHRFSKELEDERVYFFRIQIQVDMQDGILLAVCDMTDDAFQAFIRLIERYCNWEEFISIPL